jgi:hypothetical protein
MRSGFRWGKLKEGDCLEDLDVDEWMLLERMIKKQDAENVDLISLKGRNVICCTYTYSPYRAENTPRLGYKKTTVIAV